MTTIPEPTYDPRVMSYCDTCSRAHCALRKPGGHCLSTPWDTSAETLAQAEGGQ